jgi:hypothetical protein
MNQPEAEVAFGAHLRRPEDHAARLPEATAARGGVILPIWQAEAMWP